MHKGIFLSEPTSPRSNGKAKGKGLRSKWNFLMQYLCDASYHARTAEEKNKWVHLFAYIRSECKYLSQLVCPHSRIVRTSSKLIQVIGIFDTSSLLWAMYIIREGSSHDWSLLSSYLPVLVPIYSIVTKIVKIRLGLIIIIGVNYSKANALKPFV